MTQEPKNVDRPIGLALLSGMVFSASVIIIGVILLVLHPTSSASHVLPVAVALHEMRALNPTAWISIGIFALILTPVFRVFVALLSFAKVKDWRFVVVSAIVLAAMIASWLLGKA